MIIVIDGPAGAGKSTTAKAAAKKLNINYLDSGALYRAYAWLFNEMNHDKSAFVEGLSSVSVAFTCSEDRFQVFLNKNDITEHLRDSDVSATVSEVASFAEVREEVNKLMREAVKKDDYIAEGRDLGTAVFPDAAVKIFLFAAPKERAERRLKQLQKSGKDVSLGEVLASIVWRDKKDINRENDPLVKADDAIEVDTTELSFDEQVQQICTLIEEKTTLNYNP